MKKEIMYTETEVTRLLNDLFWDLRKAMRTNDLSLFSNTGRLSGSWWFQWFDKHKKRKNDTARKNKKAE